MDENPCVRFFLQPNEIRHRQYEALRAIFIEGQAYKEVATHFGYTYHALRSLVRDFRAQYLAGQLPPFSPLRTVAARRAARWATAHDQKNRRALTVGSSPWSLAGVYAPESPGSSSSSLC